MVKKIDFGNQRTWQDPNSGSTMIVSQEEYEYLEDEYSRAMMTDQQLYDRTKFIEDRERNLNDLLDHVQAEKLEVVEMQKNIHKRESILAATEAGMREVDLDLRKKLEDYRRANAKILTAIDDAVALMEVEEPAEALALMKTMQEKLDIKW